MSAPARVEPATTDAGLVELGWTHTVCRAYTSRADPGDYHRCAVCGVLVHPDGPERIVLHDRPWTDRPAAWTGEDYLTARQIVALDYDPRDDYRGR